MRKIIFFLLALFFIYGCKPDIQEVIIGKWAIEKVEVINVDELAKIFYEARKTDLQKKINYYKSQIDTITDTNNLVVFESTLKQFEQELNSLNIDTIKNEIIQNAKERNDNIFLFNSDQTFSFIYPQLNDVNKSGTWLFNDDFTAIKINVDGNTVVYNIEDFSKDHMTLSYTEAKNDKVKVKIRIYLKKISNE